MELGLSSGKITQMTNVTHICIQNI